MQIIDLTKQLPFQKSVGKRSLAQIKYAVLHHDGERTDNGVYVDIARYKAEANYHISKNWGHLSYHYKINKDGIVYLCVPETEIGYHAGNWHINQYGIGICLDGDFSIQTLLEDQLRSLQQLLNYLCRERSDMPYLIKSSIYAHREVRLLGRTFCPGNKLIEIVKNYRAMDIL